MSRSDHPSMRGRKRLLALITSDSAVIGGAAAESDTSSPVTTLPSLAQSPGVIRRRGRGSSADSAPGDLLRIRLLTN